MVKISSPFVPFVPCQLSDASQEDALDDDQVIVTSSSTNRLEGLAEIEAVGDGMGAGSGVLPPPPPPHETNIKEERSKILDVNIIMVVFKVCILNIHRYILIRNIIILIAYSISLSLIKKCGQGRIYTPNDLSLNIHLRSTLKWHSET